MKSETEYYNFLFSSFCPKRESYNSFELGEYPKVASKPGEITRNDFQITIPRNSIPCKVECTFYSINQPAPCVIYLHGNGCSRTDGYMYMNDITNSGCHLMVFDFIGTGLSEGTYNSMGYYEQDDVNAVIQKMKEFKEITKFVIWGRSLGAATAIMHMTKYKTPEVCAVICDSPYSNLTTQFTDKLHTFFSDLSDDIILETITKVKKDLSLKYGIDIDAVSPIKGVEDLKTPILIFHGNNDQLVRPQNSKDIIANYGKNHSDVKKILIEFEGHHNSYRPLSLLNEIKKFLQDISSNKF